ncbi:hypothetical protein ZIOFF_026541 [Zingiber officinale]|uniref:Nuclear pore complex protein NUP160 domain-containing protein n=1 Tax=Zingiber officinale TaxID=94328 RepID=A0A8J5LKK2_ZINOF|nr:hypothetical protein ZIOFF_026541 [Zingiber officinale]
MAAAARSLAGVEVPVLGSDKVQWIELAVPSSASSALAPQVPSQSVSGAALTPRDAAGCHAVEEGETKTYLIWRFHKDSPNTLEVIEVISCNGFPQTGLRLVFQDALCPSTYLCKNVIRSGSGSENSYSLYGLTVSGVAYLLNLRKSFPYISGSNFPQSDYREFNVVSPAQVTAMAVTSACLATGYQDGVVRCFQFGILDPDAPGFVFELRDDVGIGRLWNFVSRGKAVAAVQDMAICEVCERKLSFVLHADGFLRMWDLASHTKLAGYNTFSHELEGSKPTRLWVSEVDYDANIISLAVLHGQFLVSDIEVIVVYHFGFDAEDNVQVSSKPSIQSIRLEEGKLIDLKFCGGKLWILKGDGSMLYDLSQYDFETEDTSVYGLQEDFVAEQLFQSSEHALDDLLWTDHSVLSSMKDQDANFVSSIFLRRLLQPGIYHTSALRATLLEHKKYISEYEFHSLTLDGLKKEIFAIMEGEGTANNTVATVHFWKSFCTQFLHHWCQYSAPYAVFVDASMDVVGLIRKNSISLFRSLEGIEQLIYGFSDEFHNRRSSWTQDKDIDSELLLEMLRCMSYISHQLGGAASALYYESVVNPVTSSEDILSQLLKIIEYGYSSSMTPLIQQIGIDATWTSQQTAHRSQRKFAVDMLISLNSLCSRATNWAGVLDTIEKFLTYLDLHSTIKTVDSKSIYNVNSVLLIQATSQVARVMFETAFDSLLLLRYLINISAQVNLPQVDKNRIKVKLIPAIQEVIIKWLVIHFMGTVPTTQQSLEDFGSRLSLLNIVVSAGLFIGIPYGLDLIRLNGDRPWAKKENRVLVKILRKIAASGAESPKYLKNLSFQTGFQYPEECESGAIWKLHYYQWAMRLFEQYGASEGACEFALAALEQVDEVLKNSNNALPEYETVRGQLWANVFRFSLDLKHYRDAYCAIISNPDDESRYICLRRFVIVLCENCATKVACDGGLPFVGLLEKVEQELVWKAERSDVFAKPNIYKLLYAFEANQNNWRKAAGYMYRYSIRLKKEANLDGSHQYSSVLQERLTALSSSINALQQVDHAYAWMESQSGNDHTNYQMSPNKRPRIVLSKISSDSNEASGINCAVDIEMLEKEYILTKAQHILSLVSSKFKFSGKQMLVNLVDILIEENMYDMAFTIIVNFWKGTKLQWELERAFVAISQKCCSNRVGPTVIVSNVDTNNHLLGYSEEETYSEGKIIASSNFHKIPGTDHWETLEQYLEKYRKLHRRLPIIVAETFLHTDPQIELPLWLVHMFKGGGKVSWSMTGQEPDPATLFRLYVDYGRLAEATNMLLEYLDLFSSMRTTDLINRKRMTATWFPYMTIERLWYQLEEMRKSCHMVDDCDRLKKMLQEALMKHLQQVQIDSEDAIAAASASKMQS